MKRLYWSVQDSPTPLGLDAEWDALTLLIRKGHLDLMQQAQTQIRVSSDKQATLPVSSSKAKTISKKSRTLRQMMHEYNTRAPSTTARFARQSPTSQFTSERIAHYQVPGLRGKILRPMDKKNSS
jgi:hypothetical protein